MRRAVLVRLASCSIDFVLLKNEQPEWMEKNDWREEFELD